MPDVFARLAARLTPAPEPGPREIWGEQTILEMISTPGVAPSSATLAPAAEASRAHEPISPRGHPSRESLSSTPGAPEQARTAHAASPASAEPARPPAPTAPATPASQPASRRSDRPTSLEHVITLLDAGSEAPAPRAERRSRRSAETPTEVTVEIGQIIVRPPTEQRSLRSTGDAAPTVGSLSLSDYLAGRR